MQKMKLLIVILTILAAVGAFACPPADFAITDIKLGPEGFLEIHIANRSAEIHEPANKENEKTFLTITIEDVRRAEYKLKYMPLHLFQPLGKVTWKTNFRLGWSVRVHAQVKLPPLIPETRIEDNRLTKGLHPHAR